SAVPQLTVPGTLAAPSLQPAPEPAALRSASSEELMPPAPPRPAAPEVPLPATLPTAVQSVQPSLGLPPAMQDKNDPPTPLPPPRPVPASPFLPFQPGQVRLPALAGDNGILGCVPRPNPITQQKYCRFVKELVDPQMTLDLVVGRTRLMLL